MRGKKNAGTWFWLPLFFHPPKTAPTNISIFTAVKVQDYFTSKVRTDMTSNSISDEGYVQIFSITHLIRYQ
ncbi:hypothetical protein HanPSC8_Chr08g0315521 [Helianthus annuus]|nr:hypothetical protein HanPSC8_Chr08g0315521 [Helianthus annuus]